MGMTRYITSIKIWVHHAINDAINMVPCIENIYMYLLCTCATLFYAGVSGGDMQSLEHITGNVFEKIHL